MLSPRHSRSESNRRIHGILYLAAALGIFATSTAHAIDIRIHLDTNTSENPSWDPTGSKLYDTFNAAALIWEDLLPGPGVFDVDVEWDDDISGLGLWTEYLLANNTIEVNPNPGSNWFYDSTPLDHSEFDFTTQNRVPAEGGGWLYRRGQWFYPDIDSGERSAWFTGAPPSALEVGYRGFATSATRQIEFDLLSTAIHELGHELGVNSGEGPFEAQPAWIGTFSAGFNTQPGDDGHLAAKTALMCESCGVLGTRRLPSAIDVMAVADVLDFSATGIDLDRKEYFAQSGQPDVWSTGLRWIGGTSPDGDDDAFIRSSTLNPTVELTTLALARNLFVGQGDNLSTNAFWMAVNDTVTVDGLNTDVFVDTGGKLSATDIVVRNQAELSVLGGEINAQVLTIDSNSLLLGNGEVILLGGDSGARLINKGTIRATNGLPLSFGTNLPSGSLVWDLDGTIGNGVVDATSGNITIINGDLTDDFSGTMRVGAGRTLYIDKSVFVDAGGRIDLSGGASDSGRATFSSLSGLSLRSGATVNVSGVARINAPFGFSGVVAVAAGSHLEIQGGAGSVDGSMNIGDSAEVVFQSTLNSYNGSYTIGNGSSLTVQGATELARGSFSGTGSANFNGSTTYFAGALSVTGLVHQNGNATVNTTTETIISGSGTWDLDGDGDTVWDVNGDLTINAARIENVANHTFDGRINLNNSGTTMAVNTPIPWTMGGRLDLDSGTVLAGSAQMNVTGTVNALSSRITAPVAFQSGATVLVNVGAVLQLDGLTNYMGGAYRGGTIHQNGPANVTANTTLGQNLYLVPPNGVYSPLLPHVQWLEQFDWDGSVGAGQVTNISPGVTFTINAVEIDDDPANDGYDGTVNINGGTLLVNTGPRFVFGPFLPNATLQAGVTPVPWRLDGTMNLQEMGGHPAVVASQVGSPLYIYGEVNAIGGSAALAGGIWLTPGGEINVSNGATLSLGLSAQGRMNVQPGGLLRLNASSTLSSSVQATINGTAELASTSTFQGGSYQGSGTLRLQGNANFTQTTVLGVNTEFVAGGTSTISSAQELRLSNDGQVDQGAVFQGGGIFRNLAGSHLSLRNGAEVTGVGFINEGTVGPGSSPGTAIVDTFTQTATGNLEIEIGGTGAGEFDKLIVNNQAQLGGTLDISFVELTPGSGLFTPSPGDSFQFLTAGSFTGAFSNVNVGTRVDTADGLGSFLVSFNAGSNSLLLSQFMEAGILGDYNNDGIVNLADYTIFRDTRGQTGAGLAADGDNSGTVSDLDHGVWAANFGNTLSGGLGDVSTVPEPSSVLLLLVALLPLLRRIAY